MNEHLVLQALEFWPIDVASYEVAAVRENIVHKVTGHQGNAYALRFHRPGYRTGKEIESELQWMTALQTDGLSVPRPVMSKRGALIEQLAGYKIDLLTWLGGRPLGKAGVPLDLENREQVFFQLGSNIALLHQLSDAWKPPQDFERPKWDIDGLTGENPLWGRFWENPALSAPEKKILIASRDRARATLLQNLAALDYGLIHADFVRENILIDGSRMHFIDFDDGGFGFRLFEIATVYVRSRFEHDFPSLQNALLSGYQAHRALDVTLLPVFVMLRAFTYVGWSIPRMSEAGVAERNQRHIALALELAQTI